VPGSFDAWMLMLREHGTMELADVLAPAIGYADGGFPLVPNICTAINEVRQLFEAEWPSSAALWLKDGVPQAGSLFRSPVLAETYQRLLRESQEARNREARIEAARNAWYRGFVAEAIDRFCRETEAMDTSGRRHRGMLTGDDMARWSTTVEPPCTYDYHGYTLCKTGPWGQGPVALQQLALLKGFDLDSLSPQDPDFIHTVIECAKLAFADREAFYGDPNFTRVPIDRLLSDQYNEARRRLVGDQASRELRPGHVEGYGAAPIVRIARGPDSDIAHAGAHGRGEPTMNLRDLPTDRQGGSRGDTCHLDVIDRWGNMVSATPSGGWLQSSPAIPELGFPLSTRAQMFWLEEGMPASLAPRKRPRTTLTPSLALREGTPYMAFGTPGGDQQDQWSLNVFLRHVHFGLNLQASIDAPEFHTTHFPSSFYPREARPGHMVIERRIPQETVAALRRRGHDVEVVDDWLLGRVSAATKQDALLKAAANPRFMQGYAFGR
jgi:gamma-glutamyltranspeptidase/glutathione hydrolase